MVGAVDADALIIGGGGAGLSLAVHVVEAAQRAGRACPRVLVVEPRTAYTRDRTWCGWRMIEHPFNAAVTRRWSRWAVADGQRRVVRGTQGHPYEHIPADAFYALAQERLAAAPAVTLQLGVTATAIVERGAQVEVETSAGPLRAARVFDARPGQEPIATDVPEVELLQHFVGWEIEAERDCFDPEVVEMMDFSASQARGLYFTYVLPFSRRRALVEATYISAAPLPTAQYEADIRDYLARKHGLEGFSVLFREAGQIPMSTRPRRSLASPRVVNIGLRGGLAKASTGYAFQAIQSFSAELAARIVARPGAPVEPPPPRAAAAVAMDRVFLSYIERHPDRAPALFVDLFEKLPPALLCRFLTDHGSPLDSLRVMASTPLGQMTAEVLRSRARWLRSA
jgi:lycopene beta-cyclase